MQMLALYLRKVLKYSDNISLFAPLSHIGMSAAIFIFECYSPKLLRPVAHAAGLFFTMLTQVQQLYPQ